MKIDIILKIVLAVLSFVVATLIPTVIGLVKAIKAKKAAKTAQQEAEANSAMQYAVNGFIEEAEELYKTVDAVVKEKGGSCGAVKKDSVLTKLQAYALQNGYDYDATYWSGVVDEIVEMTRKVNSK